MSNLKSYYGMYCLTPKGPRELKLGLVGPLGVKQIDLKDSLDFK